MDTELARRRATQVGHSLNVIAELSRYVDDPNVVVGPRVAAIDAFHIHLRLLIEFLIKGPDNRDIRSHDYARNFRLDAALNDRLSGAWKRASQQVAHLSRVRVPSVDMPIFESVNTSSLRILADDVFTAMAALVQHMADTNEPWAGDFARWLAEAKARGVPPAPLSAYDLTCSSAYDLMCRSVLGELSPTRLG